MATISYIKPSGKTSRITVGIDADGDVSRYSVSENTASVLGLRRGVEISDRELSDIRLDDERFRAMKRALSLLSYADNTAKALYMKLVRAGFSGEVSRECVDECIRLGYIDERRQLERAILCEANGQLRGKRYIIRKLSSKGYRAGLIAELTDELAERGEIDFAANFRLLCDRRGAISDDEVRALAYKHGFFDNDFE